MPALLRQAGNSRPIILHRWRWKRDSASAPNDLRRTELDAVGPDKPHLFNADGVDHEAQTVRIIEKSMLGLAVGPLKKTPRLGWL